MKKLVMIGVLLAAFSVGAPGSLFARITMVGPYAFTTSYSNPSNFQLNLWLETTDDEKSHAPDYVSLIEVTDPTGTVWPITDPSLYWDDRGKGFFLSLTEADFGGPFPNGVYAVKVTDTKGKAITTKVSLPGASTPLPIPTITAPVADEVFTTTTPLIRWTAIQSRRYRITIDRMIGYCDTDQQAYYTPVWDWTDNKWTVNKFFRIPKGVLREGEFYRIRIEGRNSYGSYTKRGRSGWVNFSIAPPAP